MSLRVSQFPNGPSQNSPPFFPSQDYVGSDSCCSYCLTMSAPAPTLRPRLFPRRYPPCAKSSSEMSPTGTTLWHHACGARRPRTDAGPPRLLIPRRIAPLSRPSVDHDRTFSRATYLLPSRPSREHTLVRAGWHPKRHPGPRRRRGVNPRPSNTATLKVAKGYVKMSIRTTFLCTHAPRT